MRISTAKLLQEAARTMGSTMHVDAEARSAPGNSGKHLVRYTDLRQLVCAVAVAARSIADEQEWEHFGLAPGGFRQVTA